MTIHSFAGCIALVAASGAMAAQPMAFSLCTSETPFLPLSSVEPGRPGRSQVLIAMVEKRIGASITHVATPWRRCQLLVERGIYDAMNITGYAGINRDIAVFPMINGGADTSRSLGSVHSFLYRRVGDKADFVDSKIVHTDKPVAVLSGRQVNKDAVARAGGTSEDGAKTVLALAQKLAAGQADLAASAEPEFPELIRTRYKGVLEALPAPLTESHYYVVFSKQYFAAHQAEVERFWNAIAAVRSDPEYLQKVSAIE